MFWSIFAWLVLPLGAVSVVMLLSGNRLAMRLASSLLSTPVRLGSFRLSVAVFMVSMSFSFAVVSWSGLRRAETKLVANEWLAALDYQQQGNVFFWARNLYMALCGLCLWSVSWRLKVLYDCGQVLSACTVRQKSLTARIAYVAVGLLAFLAADIPMCRINYNIQLTSSITPRKSLLLGSMPARCEEAYLQDAPEQCAEFCAEARKLSVERFAIIKFARDWHILGRVAAEIFDEGRGVVQGEERIDGLFQKKSCKQVLRSVDKSNTFVNCICILCAAVALSGGFAALANAQAPEQSGTTAAQEDASAPPAQGLPAVDNDRPHAD